MQVTLRKERVFLFRGVRWGHGGPGAAIRMGRRLSDFWPEPFCQTKTVPEGSLVAHRGVAKILDQVRPVALPCTPILGPPSLIVCSPHPTMGCVDPCRSMLKRRSGLTSSQICPDNIN